MRRNTTRSWSHVLKEEDKQQQVERDNSGPVINWTQVETMDQMNGYTRKQQRERHNIPAWVPIGRDDPDFRQLWKTDDAHPPDEESVYQAWLRIFGDPMNSFLALEDWKDEDVYAYLYPGNRVYVFDPTGAELWQYLPPRKFD